MVAQYHWAFHRYRSLDLERKIITLSSCFKDNGTVLRCTTYCYIILYLSYLACEVIPSHIVKLRRSGYFVTNLHNGVNPIVPDDYDDLIEGLYFVHRAMLVVEQHIVPHVHLARARAPRSHRHLYLTVGRGL